MRVTLLTGCNLGNKERSMADVLVHIEREIGTILQKSSVHSSTAWGFESSDTFLNQAMVCDTTLSAEDVLMKIWDIERCFGKERGSVAEELEKLRRRKSGECSYQSRYMDIDILFYDNQAIQTDLLTIPHPLYKEREFVMKPLSELLSEYPLETLIDKG